MVGRVVGKQTVGKSDYLRAGLRGGLHNYCFGNARIFDTSRRESGGFMCQVVD